MLEGCTIVPLNSTPLSRGLCPAGGYPEWSPLAVRRHTRQALIDGAVMWRKEGGGHSDLKRSKRMIR
jgi:hypothetical protein